MSIVFASKVDSSVAAASLAAPVIALLTLLVAARHGARGLWVPALLLAGVALVVIWILLCTYYEVAHDALIVHAGPFAWRIPLREISAVRPSRSARSGPALSLDRLEISWGTGRSLLISPRDQAGFLALLHRRAPQLTAQSGARV
ncbi:MAG TPA: PH domain-containing protein [Steroidobacteraceae bacterium]|nr:PH domain-containing protein [Steroidobacteraceae bacterium]